ncbi:MAG: pyrroloquinoline quinone biosynthesis protein PqqB, partial [Gammaproteobacteria bacterium]
SIAVSADGEDWFLFNASPDLRQQINDNDILHPKKDLRHSPIMGAVLTNADVDHVAGLLNLRESQPLNLYATGRVLEVLEANNIFNVLNPEFVSRNAMSLEQTFELMKPGGVGSGIEITPFAVPGKVALWLEDESKGDNLGSVDEDTIALYVADKRSGKSFYYMPACADMTAELAGRIDGADLIFFDGTLWVDDEMIRDGVGVKTGKRMGHMSLSGENGTLEAFSKLNIKRKIFIHINTTNPILFANSEESKTVQAAGWEVSYDGMQVAV